MKNAVLCFFFFTLVLQTPKAHLPETGDLFAASVGERCGYISTDGTMAIGVRFENCWHFAEGLAGVIIHGKLGFIDKTGALVIAPQFDWNVAYFSEGLAPVSLTDAAGNKRRGYVDRQGKLKLLSSITHAGNFSNGLAVVERKAVNGYINRKMEFEIEPVFTFASSFADGLALVRRNGEYYYINTRGQQVINRNGSSFSEGLAFFEVESRYGLMDTTGNVLAPPQFDDVEAFSNGLAGVRINNKWGYADRTGTIVIAPEFEKAGDFSSDGIAPVMKNGKYGFIDRTGQAILGFAFDSAEWLSGGLGYVEQGAARGYINKSGMFVWRSSRQ